MNSAYQKWNQVLFATLPAIAIAAATLPAQAVTPLPPTATVDGKTQAELTAEWWQFAFGLPVSQNPLVDPTGANANFGQSGSVFFLFGSLDGAPTNRQITIADDQYLFFPLTNGAYVAFPDENLTEAELRALAADAANIGRVTSLSASVNGVEIDDLFDYRQLSPLFGVTLPADNIFGVPELAGDYEPAASDGYWLLLPPLAQGKYTITFGATGVSFDGSPFVQDNTYQVTSVPEPMTVLGVLTGGVFGVVARKRRQLQK